MRFHTTLSDRVDSAGDLGWNVALTLALLQLSREEPAFRLLTPAPYPRLSRDYQSGSGEAWKFEAHLLENSREWCEQPGVGDAFDEFIIWQAASFGMFIMQSEFVRERVMRWWSNPSQPDKQRRIVKSFELAIERVFDKTGDNRAPMTDPALHRGRKEMLPELNGLFRKMAEGLGAKRTVPSSDEVIAEFCSLVAASPSHYPNVHRNLDSIVAYLKDETNGYSERIGRGQPVSATNFFDDWFANGRGYSHDYVRRRFTELGPGR